MWKIPHFFFFFFLNTPLSNITVSPISISLLINHLLQTVRLLFIIGAFEQFSLRIKNIHVNLDGPGENEEIQSLGFAKVLWSILRKFSCRDRKTNSSIFELLSIVVLFVLASDGITEVSEWTFLFLNPCPPYDKYDLLHVDYLLYFIRLRCADHAILCSKLYKTI